MTTTAAHHFLNTFNTASTTTTDIIPGYTLAQVIGYGSTATIRKAYSLQDRSVLAVKIVPASPLALKEAHTWSLLSHEHILPLFSFHKSIDSYYFFTLYCPAGSLFDLLKSIPNHQDDVGMIFRQIVRGLSYLHNIVFFVHRDIKLENILIDEMGSCRIADFGLAVSFHPPSPTPSPLRFHRNSTSTHSLRNVSVFQPGSLPYAAPELLIPQSMPHSPHPSQDIWALGVLLYTLLSGSLPFYDSFEPRLQLKILKGSYPPLQDIGLGAERILKGCLDKNSSTRWSIDMIDQVAWGVGWGTEGDHAVDEQDEDDDIILNKNPAGASTTNTIGPSRSLSPSSSDSSDDSSSQSPLSPLRDLSVVSDVEIVSSPKTHLLMSAFESLSFDDDSAAAKRGRKMRSL